MQVNSTREHPPGQTPGKPRAFVTRWVPGAGHLAVSSVPAPPGICKQPNTCFVASCRHFRRRSELRVSSSQALSFWSRWRAFIDHKRPIKAVEPFALSFFSVGVSHFVTCFMQFYWAETVTFNKMATNTFVYWSDGLGGRAFDHHSRNGERGICQQILPAGPGIWTMFSNSRVEGGVCGWNWLAHHKRKKKMFSNDEIKRIWETNYSLHSITFWVSQLHL